MMMVLAVHLYVVIHCGPAITKDLIGPMMPDCTYFGPIPDFMAPLVGLDIFCRFNWTTEGNLKKEKNWTTEGGPRPAESDNAWT